MIGDFPLSEDDQIRVFSVTEFRPERYVAITGAVRNSGQVPFREGMTVRDLVLLAGGLEQSADLREAEIARLPADRRGGATATTSRVPLDSSYIFERGPDGKYFGPPGLPAPNGSGPEIRLRPYDNVLIFRQPNWALQRTAVVSGEVTRPGTYSLTKKTERISDIITRAGGLTPEAYADGVTFYRVTDKVGRIGIALPEILRNPRSRDNLQLQDGDSIFIPRFNAVVNVKGAVNSPVAVTYVPGRSLEYYVRAAGGITRKGDLRYAYVTQPNGKVEATSGKFIFKNDPRPRPGKHCLRSGAGRERASYRLYRFDRIAGAGRGQLAGPCDSYSQIANMQIAQQDNAGDSLPKSAQSGAAEKPAAVARRPVA